MYSENPSGVGIYTREILNNLQQKIKEDNIEMVYYSYTSNGLKGNNKIVPVKLPFLFEYLFKWFLPLHRILWNFFYLPFLAKKFDLVYSLSSHGSPFIKKQIITIHDLICFHFPRQHTFQFLYFKYLFPSVIKAAKQIIAISNFTKNEIVKYYNAPEQKVCVVYNGSDHLANLQEQIVETEIKSLQNIKTGKAFFLAVGASYPHKNTYLLIQAMEKLPEYLLVVTGSDNSYIHKLKKYVKRQNINNIIFAGYVSNKELQVLYTKCCANIYLGMFEGFGFPPMEAASYNKISVVASSGALIEIYDNAVVYVNNLNRNEIAETLIKVTSPQFDKVSYINRFNNILLQYTWNNSANNIYNIIIKTLTI